MDEYMPSNKLQWMEEMLTLERSSFVNRIGAITAIVKEISAAIAAALSVLAGTTRGALLALQLAVLLVAAVPVMLFRLISATILSSISLANVLKRLLGISTSVMSVSVVYSGLRAIRSFVASSLVYLQMDTLAKLIARIVSQIDNVTYVAASVIFPRLISATYQASLSLAAYSIDVGVSVVSAISSSLQAVVSANVIKRLIVSASSVSMSLSVGVSLVGHFVGDLVISIGKTVGVSANRYISALLSSLANVYSLVLVWTKLISTVNASVQLINTIIPVRGIVPASVVVVSSMVTTMRRLVGLASSTWHYVYVSALPNARLAVRTVVSIIFGTGIQLKVLLKPAVMSRYGRAFSSVRSAMSIIVLGRRTGGHRR